MSNPSCIPPDKLARWLSGELDHDAADELDRHVEGCSRCQVELDRMTSCRISAALEAPLTEGLRLLSRQRPAGWNSTTGLMDDHQSPDVDSALPDTAPTLTGYEILRVLGRGGMGRVYLARQIGLERLVAIKVLTDDRSGDPQLVARLKQEARALASIRHPNVVPVFDVLDYKGRPAIVLEYVADGSLTRFCKQRDYAYAQACELMEQVARGVQAGHRQGIVHRDLKPANILLDGSTPKVADFGLALNLQSTERMTHSGDVFGTPEYMAPEQIRQGAQDCTPQSDIYSLGAILYELLTGRPPFVGKTAFDTMDLVASGKLLPPRQVNPEIPQSLNDICLRALAKRPEDRYASAGDFAEALAIAARQLPTLPPPGVPSRPAPDLWSRLRSPAGLAVVGAMLVGVTVLLLPASPTTDATHSGDDATTGISQPDENAVASAPAATPPAATPSSMSQTSANRSVAETFIAGSHWEGTYTFLPAPEGQVDGDLELVVESREGNRFKGIYSSLQGQYAWRVAGVLRNDTIEWDYVSALRENENRDVVGKVHVSGQFDKANPENLDALWRQGDETCRLSLRRVK